MLSEVSPRTRYRSDVRRTRRFFDSIAWFLSCPYLPHQTLSLIDSGQIPLKNGFALRRTGLQAGDVWMVFRDIESYRREVGGFTFLGREDAEDFIGCLIDLDPFAYEQVPVLLTWFVDAKSQAVRDVLAEAQKVISSLCPGTAITKQDELDAQIEAGLDLLVASRLSPALQTNHPGMAYRAVESITTLFSEAFSGDTRPRPWSGGLGGSLSAAYAALAQSGPNEIEIHSSASELCSSPVPA